MKHQSTVLIPIYCPHDADDSELVKLIGLVEEHTRFANVHVINQVKRLHFPSEETGKVFVQHHPEGLGTWGSLHYAYDLISQNEAFSPVETAQTIAINLAVKFFPAEIVEKIIQFQQANHLGHATGRRVDIASSLAPNNSDQGYVRAVMESFLTALASAILTNKERGDLFKDGFVGLHCFSRERYFASKWEWVHHTNWGGALQSQIQSVEGGFHRGTIKVAADKTRNWNSVTFGGGVEKAIMGMFDKARHLPIFAQVTEELFQFTLENFHYAFANQPWMKDESKDDLLDALSYYNNNSANPLFVNF
jgi:hypothetical protein